MLETDSHVAFNFSTGSSQPAAISALQNISYFDSRASATAGALTTVNMGLFNKTVLLPNTSRLVILTVDGPAQEGTTEAVNAALALRSQGIRIVVVAVDVPDNATLEELRQIASSRSDVYQLRDLERLSVPELQARFLNLYYCPQPATTTTTAAPTTARPVPFCSDFVATDNVFILDGSGSMEDRNFNRVKTFFGYVAQALPVHEEQARFALAIVMFLVWFGLALSFGFGFEFWF